jgi:DNA-binding protein WhiA
MLAEIAGFIRVAGSIGLAGFGKFKIRITTENPAVARHYKKLIQDYFGIETKLEIGEGHGVGKAQSKFSYIINIDADNLAEQILRECGILLIKEGNNYISDGIYAGIIRTKCCKKAYLRGVFLAAGTMSDPEKSYDLEFVLDSQTMAADLKKMINSFVDLNCKVVQRGKKHVVYMKKADYISDTLAIMGASNQVFSMEETRIKKEMVNSAKRMSNCDSANMDRSIEASMKQVEAIKKIDEIKGIDSLNDKLREVAYLRLEHPDISIAALGELCDPPLKKSGINNRLRRLEEMAAKL